MRFFCRWAFGFRMPLRSLPSSASLLSSPSLPSPSLASLPCRPLQTFERFLFKFPIMFPLKSTNYSLNHFPAIRPIEHHQASDINGGHSGMIPATSHKIIMLRSHIVETSLQQQQKKTNFAAIKCLWSDGDYAAELCPLISSVVSGWFQLDFFPNCKN